MNAVDPGALVEPVITLARRAGELIRRTEPGKIDFKGEVNLVTQADRLSEALLVEGLRACLPQARVLTEEGAADTERGGFLWVVDPLDGTTNFAHGYPVFAVAVALVKERRPVMGVVYDPTRDECFHAVRGGGAFLNGRAISCSSETSLPEALLATGFPYDIRTSERDNLRQFAALAKKARGVRRGGSAALDLSYVAAGRLDGYWEEKLAPWDIAAGALLVEEAGGRVTDYEGRALDAWQGRVVAAREGLHRALIQELRRLEG